MTSSQFTIGQVASAAEVGIETVRFYERRGLIVQPVKAYRGIRRYPAAVVTRIRFIKHAQELGFTLAEVQELLDLQVNPENSCAAVKLRAEAKRATVRAKMESLRLMEQTLTTMIQSCANEASPIHACPILASLENLSVGSPGDPAGG